VTLLVISVFASVFWAYAGLAKANIKPNPDEALRSLSLLVMLATPVALLDCAHSAAI
jgi:hypothetical protein